MIDPTVADAIVSFTPLLAGFLSAFAVIRAWSLVRGFLRGV